MPGTPGPAYDRFWTKVDMSGGLSECWPWTGAISTKRKGANRGIFRIGPEHDHRVVIAHRLALCYAGAGYEEYFRPQQAAHRCNNPICCNNYSHLYWATQRENQADRWNHFNHPPSNRWAVYSCDCGHAETLEYRPELHPPFCPRCDSPMSTLADLP